VKNWKPQSYPSVSPYLIAQDTDQLIGFLTAVFDGSLVQRIDRPDGTLMHAEMRIDDSIIMIGGASTEYMSAQAHLHVYVRDANLVYNRAIALGAPAIQPPVRKTEDDDLRGGFTDPAGNTWWVATQ
jgi:PhnB protein